MSQMDQNKQAELLFKEPMIVSAKTEMDSEMLQP